MSLDPRVFKAIAGAGKIPAVGSLVYYFPEGHVEQSSPSANLSSISVTKPFTLCKVGAVDLLASAETDEVFIKIQLDPTDCSFAGDSIGYEFGKDVVSFAKILTPSDANNGGGFSVPRFCADSIFPKLDFTADPPLQTLTVKDVHGKIWEFRHIYRGTPRRHLLTTGWSKFVNSKKLVAGDSIVFVKDGEEKLFVGVRRTTRFCGNSDGLRLDENGFSRNAKNRVSGELVADAIRAMEMGRRFEVLYYPRVGMSVFVVGKEVVDRVRGVYWVEGMRVKMAVETDDASRVTWFQGTVRRREVKDSGPWANSPWRMLQVSWDESEILQNVRAVSPWQVEIASPPACMQATFPVMKKAKVQQEDLEFPSEERGNVFFTQSDTSSMKMGNFTSLWNYPTSPAGMQGARQNFFVPSLSNFVQWNSHFPNKPYGINGPEGLNTSELDTASPPNQETMQTSQLEAASPPSKKSIKNDNLELTGFAACNPARKVSTGSIQLFGQIIHADKPNGRSADREKAQSKDIRQVEFSLSFPHRHLLDGVDVQHQRTVEACSL